MKDSTLCNRLAVATFAVILLWMSSLAVSLSIVRYYIASPSTDAVYSACGYAHSQTTAEHDSYNGCAKRQLQSCRQNFDATVEESLTRAEANSKFNNDLLTAAEVNMTIKIITRTI